MAKFQANVTINPYLIAETFRLGDGAGTANPLTKLDNGKFSRLKGDSLMGLCAAGDEIEAVINVVEDLPPSDGYNMGSVDRASRFYVTLDGLQATPGTGVVAVGDFLVCGTVVARGTTLGGVTPKACKATAAGTGIVFKNRLISIIGGGSGVVGAIGVAERVL